MAKNKTGLAPRVPTTFAASQAMPRRPPPPPPRLGDQLAELGEPGRGAVVRPARGQRGVGRLADEAGRVEVRLADPQVNDAPARSEEHTSELQTRFGNWY